MMPWRVSSHFHWWAPTRQISVPCLAATFCSCVRACNAESSMAVTCERPMTTCWGLGLFCLTIFSTVDTRRGVTPKKRGPCRCTTSMRWLEARSLRSWMERSRELETVSVLWCRVTGSTLEDSNTSVTTCRARPSPTAQVMSLKSAISTMMHIVRYETQSIFLNLSMRCILMKAKPRFRKTPPRKNCGMYGDTGSPVTKTIPMKTPPANGAKRWVPPSMCMFTEVPSWW
mmetsp:Transcript_26734/g.73480  ORF Transcript_26734/g.73480 Transcript_26734/m.73480 type:complete len:229 (+) Transcript_26734:795-1481(+)